MSLHATRIIFFGTSDFSAAFLRALIGDATLHVVGVVTQPDEPVGRKKVLTPPPVKDLARAHSIPVLQPTKLKDPAFRDALAALAPDRVVVVAYGRIIPADVLAIVPGALNVHPSLLPKYRGPSPIQSAIAAGETETGVTIMQLDAEMDHGPVLAQETISVAPDETQESLFTKVVTVGVPLLLATLRAHAQGDITPHEQDHAQATYCALLSREDGRIDWRQPAEVIDRRIRAYNPWPGTSTVWERKHTSLPMKIFSARQSPLTLPPATARVIDGRLYVGTGTTALELLDLQPAGGKRMSVLAFLAGHHDIDGANFA